MAPFTMKEIDKILKDNYKPEIFEGKLEYGCWEEKVKYDPLLRVKRKLKEIEITETLMKYETF